MIVYAETNFVVELILLQDECDSCEEMLEIAENEGIRLILPSFSLTEPYGTWYRRDARRRELRNRMDEEIRELSRSRPYRRAETESAEFTAFLARTSNEEKARHDDVRRRVLDVAEIIPLARDTLASAVEAEEAFSLEMPDAVVFSSVLGHAGGEAGEKCFLNKDKHFQDPDIQAELNARGCIVIPRFTHGLEYVRSRVTSD